MPERGLSDGLSRVSPDEVGERPAEVMRPGSRELRARREPAPGAAEIGSRRSGWPSPFSSTPPINRPRAPSFDQKSVAPSRMPSENAAMSTEDVADVSARTTRSSIASPSARLTT